MRLGITMGDPAGVGPEILLRTFAAGRLPVGAVVVGDIDILQFCSRILGLDISIERIPTAATDLSSLNHAGAADAGEFLDPSIVSLPVVDMALIESQDLRVGVVSARAGKAALGYVRRATDMAMAREIDALCTLPVNKEAVRYTEGDFSGHTEYIARRCGTVSPAMMLASKQLIVSHVSTHIGLREAVRSLHTERIVEVIKLSHQALAHLRKSKRIVVAGLNPHAGEGGAFGSEEKETIAPAVETARSLGLDVSGPEPPDTVFHRAANGRFDCVVAMYHDQGHIAMKVLDFDGGVNLTLGLPIIRTSVDHGTAFDIAYQGEASTRSFELAIEYAQRLAAGRAQGG